MAYGNNQFVAQRIANGAIGANLIVAQDIANDGKAIQATANYGHLIGVSPNYSTADGVALQITGGGVAQVLLGGTVAAGDYIKADANGKGVAIATGGTTPQHTVGIAVRAGVSGDIIPVQVAPETLLPGQDYLS